MVGALSVVDDALWGRAVLGVLSALALAQVLGLLLISHLTTRYFRRRLGRDSRQSKYRPPALVVLPCKGVDPSFDETVRGLLTLDYPDYELVFVVESVRDPAYERLEHLTAGAPPSRRRIVIAGPSRAQGQKVHNLLAATAQLSDRVEVIAFLDSDAIPRPEWLRRLVAPLENPKCEAVTGYRWFVARRGDIPGTLLSALNSSIAFLYGQFHRWTRVWGGTWAVRRSTFETLVQSGAWAGAVTEDVPVSRYVLGRGQRIVYEPACLVASPVSSSWRSMFEFGRRQYLIIRVYDPEMWWLALIGCVFSASVYLGTAAICLIGRPWGWASTLALGTLTAYWAVQGIRAILRGYAAAVRFPHHRRAIRRTIRLDAMLHPALSLVHLAIVVSSAIGSRICWRGIGYDVRGRHETRVLFRAPESATVPSAGAVALADVRRRAA